MRQSCCPILRVACSCATPQPRRAGLLTGCDIVDGPSSEKALRVVSQFNDWVQARLFNPNRLAETYPESAITRPFPFNAYYPKRRRPTSTRTATSSSSMAWSRTSSRGR
jgi:hypothetical protein